MEPLTVRWWPPPYEGNVAEGRSGNSYQEYGYGSYRWTVISTTNHHLHDGPSCTSVIANKKDSKCGKMEAIDGSSCTQWTVSWFVDGNSELEKKVNKKDSKCGIMGGLDGSLWPRRFIMASMVRRILDSQSVRLSI